MKRVTCVSPENIARHLIYKACVHREGLWSKLKAVIKSLLRWMELRMVVFGDMVTRIHDEAEEAIPSSLNQNSPRALSRRIWRGAPEYSESKRDGGRTDGRTEIGIDL